MKSILISISLRLQIIPFIWLLSLIYHIAVRAAVLATKRVPGVVAIYLTGSMARGRAIPGLSDIDFKVFVEGARNPAPFRAIRDRFALLRRFFPMLGPPDEKGIYFLEDFESDYRHYPLLRFLFDEGAYGHRLLWGDAIMGNLPVKRLLGTDSHLPFIWKFKDWMEKVVTLINSSALSPIQERYLLYKAVSDVCAIYLRLISPEEATDSREDCLQRMKAHVAPPDGSLIRQLLSERRSYFKKAVADREDIFSVFRHIMERCLGLIENNRPKPVAPPESIPESIERRGSKSTADAIASLCPAGTKVTPLPWQNIPLSPLDCSYFGAPLYLVKPPRPLRLEEILRIRDWYRSELVAEAAIMIRDNDRYLYSPYSDLLDHWFSPRLGDDLMFSFAETLHASTGSSKQLEEVMGRFRAYHYQIGGMVESDDIYRIDRIQYLKLLFSTVRAMALCRSLERGETRVFHSPADVISFLQNESPIDDGFLRHLREEYDAVVERGEDFDEALLKKSKLLIEKLSRLDWEKHGLESLASINQVSDLESLSISVIVITRSRCRQLKRCLDSLARLVRQPDELIVVDNGSTDDTREMVLAYEAPFPVRYVCESREGIAFARNSGVRQSVGDICAFTDDDAVVEPDWLAAVESAFLRDPTIGIVGGRIENLPCDRKDAVYRYFEMTTEM